MDIQLTPEVIEALKGVASNLWTLILVPLELLRQKLVHYEKLVMEVHDAGRAMDVDIDAIQVHLAQTLTHQEVRAVVDSVVMSCHGNLREHIDDRHALVDAKLRHHQDTAERIERNLQRLIDEQAKRQQG